MIALKKLYGDELLRLALVLSLLKVSPNDYLERETQQMIAGLHISNGSDWSLEQEARTFVRPRFIHPKSLDNVLINYERELFEELNSLGRYADRYIENNDRMWNNRAIHTYLVNNVATDTVAPALAPASVAEDNPEDGVSADDNVAQEVKVSDEDSTQPEIQLVDFIELENQDEISIESENQANDSVIVENQSEDGSDQGIPKEEEPVTRETPRPDAVITLSADFFSNRSESDIFAELATRSFDVNEFLVQPNEMQIKKEPREAGEADLLDVEIKKERQHDDFYNDNAMDDFVPYFAEKAQKFEMEEPHSVYHQNMADLQDYGELFDDIKELRNNLDFLDVKQQQENLEQYLLENTPLDAEAYELAPMFEEELVLEVKRERASTSFTSASSSGVSDMDMSVTDIDVKSIDVKLEPDEGHHTGDELTQEDMDLIKVLWKQDVDMGFSLEDPTHLEGPHATKVELEDELDKELKAAAEKIQRKKEEEIEKVKASLLDPEVKEDDPWAGLSYTVDTETGEYVIQGSLPPALVNSEESRFDLLEEALQLVELGDEVDPKDEQPEAVEGGSSGGGGGAGAMLHPAMRHVPHHPLAHYHNQSLMRSMSVEQRWQDLASLLTIPPPPVPDQYQHYHHQHPHNISAHGAAGYAANYHHHASIPPAPEKHPDSYPGAAAPLESAYKVEAAHHPQQHDGIYYQNSSSEMGPPPPNQDGFLQSILNDEDLQLMDMAMNEGMYTMRMLDGAGAPHHAPLHTHSHMMVAERDSASDSAVSSMGSERVPSLSDGEWCDGSDSAQEFHSSKFRPYDGAYGRERAAPHQAQKKHHMFGKRCFQEQQQQAPPEPLVPPRAPGIVKYECPEQAYHHDTMHMHNVEFAARHQLPPPHAAALQPPLDLNTAHSSHALLQSGVPSPSPHPARYAYAAPERVRHNHTYGAPPAAPDQRPAAVRDKRVRRMTDGSLSDGGSSATSSGHHLSRDEKRAKALGKGIPLEVQDIINLPMDEFNERLSKHDLSEAQLSLIRDIRRRGKNKVAAQNCRKRKLDQITSLADEVRTVRDRKHRTQRDHSTLTAERQRVKECFAALYRHVFQNLRDPEGRPLSSAQYSLQQAADGNVVLVPKMPQHHDHLTRSDDEMDRKAKNYEQ